MADFTVHKCGIRFDPPAIGITYSLNDSGKMRRRTMPIRNFNKNCNVEMFCEDFRNVSRHKKYLYKIPKEQLEKLFFIIQDHQNGLEIEDSLRKYAQLHKIDPDEDLNKVDLDVLQKKKEMMEKSFLEHQKKPDDPDWQYDIEIDFAREKLESCGWDSNSEIEEKE